MPDPGAQVERDSDDPRHAVTGLRGILAEDAEVLASRSGVEGRSSCAG